MAHHVLDRPKARAADSMCVCMSRCEGGVRCTSIKKRMLSSSGWCSKPLYWIMLACRSRRSVIISFCRAAMDFDLLAWVPTSFTAIISPVSSSIASYTLPNVPCPSILGGFAVCHLMDSSVKYRKEDHTHSPHTYHPTAISLQKQTLQDLYAPWKLSFSWLRLNLSSFARGLISNRSASV
jgi:hypothetical protein